MGLGTTSIDGLMSGLDTASIISSLAAVQTRPLTLVTSHITKRQSDLQAYQSLSAKLLTLRNSAATLASGSSLAARSAAVSNSEAVVASASSGAAVGQYQLVVHNLAEAHKLSSAAVADAEADLGSSGEFRLNGKNISFSAGDSLSDLSKAINGAQAGVSASIITVSSNDHRLVLRSQSTGTEQAIDLAQVSGNILKDIGLVTGVATARHPLADGMTSDTLDSQTTTIGASLGLTDSPAGTVRINGTEVAVDLSTASLQDLAAAISEQVEGVTASVTATVTAADTRYSLQLTGNDGTAPALVDDQHVLETMGLVKQGVANELQAAEDAVVELDGYTITRASNSLDDVLEGVSLDLKQADSSRTITLNVSANNQPAINALQQVVSDYNSVMSAINAGNSFNSDTSSGGVFFSDPAILNLQGGLAERAMAPAALGAGGSLTLMSQIGLSTDRYGMLSLNTGTLQEALETNPQGVLRMFTTQGETTHDEVEYVSSTAETGASNAAGYAVNVTQAATKATAQTTAFAGGLAQDETLVINEKYTISLRAGMTPQQVADHLNGILSGNRLPLTASVVDDRVQLQSSFYGSSYGFSIKSSLADGLGGTDLGGASDAQLQTYYGQNVAGTIGACKAEGYGQWLTGTEGAAKWLKLTIASETTGDKGTVKLSQGFASRLSNYAQQVTGTDTGLVTRATTAVTDEIEQLTEQADTMQDGVDRYVEQMQLKFAAMEGVLAKNKSMLSYLTSQISGLQGLSVDTNA
jgi:flagellar hook-associated protein 2